MAARLLRFVASEHEALAGDLSEELQSGRSTAWFWRQLLGAVVLTVWTKRRPVPGIVAIALGTSEFERSTQAFGLLDPAPMQLKGRRLSGVGGAGLLGTILLITLVMPQAWFLVLFGFLGGVVVGVILVRQRHDGGLAGPTDSAPITLFGSWPRSTQAVTPDASGRTRALRYLEV
jgi:hypothetical protein